MPHFKCATCTTRRFVAGGTPGSCEGCGAALERVVELTEIVGYRVVAPQHDAGPESYEVAVAMAIRSMDQHGEERTR